jgi:hypothetical protein
MKRSEWQAVAHRLSKRKRAGKESDVYIGGIYVRKEKIRKETSRNAESTTEKYRQGNPPYKRSFL